MSASVYLENIYYKKVESTETRSPRARYQQYVSDLYEIYPGAPTEESLYEGDQLTYAELGDQLFENESLRAELNSLDTIIVAHWSKEYDPDYASCGPYFLHQYGLKADIFDVCDMGSMAPFMALKVLSQYLSSRMINKGMVLCLEQNTIPRDKSAGDIVPAESGAFGLVLSREDFGYQISQIETLTESQVIENYENLEALILEKLDQEIDYRSLQLITRKGTALWKLINKNILSGKSSFLENNVHFIEPNPGCLSAFKKLQEVIAQESHSNQLLLIDEDVESMSVSFCLLEKAL